MKFKDKIIGDVGVLELKGKLMGLPETDELQSEIKAMIGQKIKKVVLDLHHVKWMNSSGLGAVMSCHTTMKSNDGELCLSRISDKVNSILILTQLTKIFNTYDSVDEAIKSLK
jgi:anti-sigma B factor antagonist